MSSPSPTRKFWQEAGRLSNFPFAEKLHGLFYMRYPYLYIATGTRSNWLGRFAAGVSSFFSRLFPPRPAKPGAITFADTYHGKVVPLQTALELVSVKENISVPDLEHVIPYKLARSLILDHPDHLAVLDCPCRAAREHPCLPLDVCLIIGEPFVEMVLKHQPQRARSITTQEAVAILEAEEERGGGLRQFPVVGCSDRRNGDGGDRPGDQGQPEFAAAPGTASGAKPHRFGDTLSGRL